MGDGYLDALGLAAEAVGGSVVYIESDALYLLHHAAPRSHKEGFVVWPGPYARAEYGVNSRGIVVQSRPADRCAVHRKRLGQGRY